MDLLSIINLIHLQSQEGLSIAQLLKFNKHRENQKRITLPVGAKAQQHPASRHSKSQQTLLPIFIGLMLHTKTPTRKLVNKLVSLGVGISFDHVFGLFLKILIIGHVKCSNKSKLSAQTFCLLMCW